MSLCHLSPDATCPALVLPSTLVNPPTNISPQTPVNYNRAVTWQCNVPGRQPQTFAGTQTCLYDVNSGIYNLTGSSPDCGGLLLIIIIYYQPFVCQLSMQQLDQYWFRVQYEQWLTVAFLRELLAWTRVHWLACQLSSTARLHFSVCKDSRWTAPHLLVISLCAALLILGLAGITALLSALVGKNKNTFYQK